MAAIAWPYDPPFQHGIKQGGIFPAVQGRRMIGAFGQFGHERRRRFAGFAGPQSFGSGFGGAFGQPFGKAYMGLQNLCERDPRRHQLRERPGGGRNGVEPIGYLFLARRLQRALYTVKASFRTGTAQHRALDGAQHPAKIFLRLAARGQRMLERRQKGDRRGALGNQPSGEA
mgnify:CR=1 FL=1